MCVYLGEVDHKRFSQPPGPEVLVDYLHRNFPGATYHSVYEAGYFGFWIHGELTRLGVNSIGIKPADVPPTDKERCTKTDRVDATKLAPALASGQLTPIYVPERVAPEDRTLIRMRMTFVRKQTRAKNQAKRSSSFRAIGYRQTILIATGRAPTGDGWRASRLIRTLDVQRSRHYPGSSWQGARRLLI